MAIKLMPAATPAPHVEPEDQNPAPRVPRKRRRAAVFDADGREVLISLSCLKCHTLRPLSMFGLRKMADGAIRNQPWCRVCRGASSAKKNVATEIEAVAAAVVAEAPVVIEPTPVAVIPVSVLPAPAPANMPPEPVVAPAPAVVVAQAPAETPAAPVDPKPST